MASRLHTSMPMSGSVKPSRRWLFLLPIAVFFLFAKALLVPILCGAIFAVALAPVCSLLRRRFGSRAPTLVVILALTLVALPIIACVALGSADIAELSGKLLGLERASMLREMSRETTRVVNRLGLPITASAVYDVMYDAVELATGWLRELWQASVRGTADTMLALLVFLIVFYTGLRDHARLQRRLLRLLPLQPMQSLRLLRMLRDASVDAVLGACLVGLVQACLLLLALVVLGVPGAWLLAIVGFFLSFIPVVGTAPVSLFAIVYLLLQHQPRAALAMLVAAAIVGISDNALRLFVRPRGSTPALVSFVAVLSGLELLGLPGLFIGPIVGGLATWGVRELLRTTKGRIAAVPAPAVPTKKRFAAVARAMQFRPHRRVVQ